MKRIRNIREWEWQIMQLSPSRRRELSHALKTITAWAPVKQDFPKLSIVRALILLREVESKEKKIRTFARK